MLRAIVLYKLYYLETTKDYEAAGSPTRSKAPTTASTQGKQPQQYK